MKDPVFNQLLLNKDFEKQVAAYYKTEETLKILKECSNLPETENVQIPGGNQQNANKGDPNLFYQQSNQDHQIIKRPSSFAQTYYLQVNTEKQ